MSLDAFDGQMSGLQSPATRIEEIIPDDATDLARVTRALNVAQAGLVRLITLSGDQSDVFIGAGVAFPIRATRVMATGTTATGIRGLS
ncbi:MAG: hypothetical protein CL814_08520 [Confluentimicrobium sp.]|jgi:hypothetical protein|uniref:Uncharacterized protein n=1 Tax=Actibacterium naphthalenivorans TaxID=1614693 RepID=A0A840CH83_9RHOB|nr:MULTISPECIES: hypothetical protein [Actibacterium]KGB83651.1 hypothetical protein JT55_00475 [Rhodovulum sp. NI22]MDY6860308.1 hypothetical protein [Pseudomonadota bacterium]ALG88953.1 hypothetical protein TQ29_00740 [Actibacterium sp. EMB200-NS6]MBB4021507.1 hypothetical protein [Actibacterium naphthalenivorans]MBC56966.1 hypothetical protein [Actibacterium sp.]|tara:strand:+ start:2906 stop:3169 length:264 start_codon:yes stop_codon:yes gene_type:complete